MIIKTATREQVKYSCENYHYSKKTPPYIYAYSFYNDKTFCGVITFGMCNRNGSMRFHLLQGECLELNRCALNGKQSCTSKCISLAIKQLKKDAKHVKLLVSYADSRQGHIGTIYQATNWYYDAASCCNPGYIINGKFVHRRTLQKYDKTRIKTVESVKPMIKWRYYYPLSKDMIPLLEKIKKQYPKKIQNNESI